MLNFPSMIATIKRVIRRRRGISKEAFMKTSDILSEFLYQITEFTGAKPSITNKLSNRKIK